MRYIIELELDKPEVPLDYHRIFLSFLKFALKKYEGGKFFEEYYGVGKKKAITFGVIFNEPHFSKEIITLQNPQIKMILASHDQKTAFVYFNALLEAKGAKHNIGAGNTMMLKRIRMDKEVDIYQNAVLFKMTSALCLRQHEREGNIDRYVSVESKDFYDVLRNSISEECQEYDRRLVSFIPELKIDAHRLRKTVVSFYGQKMEVSIGNLAFMGNPLLLDGIAKMNLGSRRGAGFGLLTYIDQWEVN